MTVSPTGRAVSINGRILDYDWRNSVGIITGDDGFRYNFALDNWKSEQMPSRGMNVNFVVDEGNALQIFVTTGSSSSTSGFSDSKKLIAGLLAILVGCFGIHKFYLNSISKSGEYTVPGVMLLVAGTVGWILVIPGLISVVIGIVEGVTYLTKAEEEFHQIYITGKRAWF
tara:strand:- start:799 stop:1308 length:510 start_codon:yes stop_codon:yes gene_type:complete